PERGLQGRRAEGEYSADGFEDLDCRIGNADTVWFWGMGGDGKGLGWERSPHGRPGFAPRRSESGDVSAARPWNRSDGSAQSFLVGRAAHLLHARSRAWVGRVAGGCTEAGARPDREGHASSTTFHFDQRRDGHRFCENVYHYRPSGLAVRTGRGD